MRHATLRMIGLFSSLIVSPTVWAQSDVVKNADDRVVGKVLGVVTSNDDPSGMMQNYQLSVQWWTLLGQAVEFYGLQWQSSGRYTVRVDGKTYTVQRRDLVKYPDLSKRFDDLRPSHLDLVVYGKASGKNFEIERGSPLINGEFFHEYGLHKQKGKLGRKEKIFSRLSLQASVIYDVLDHKLMYSRAGSSGEDFLPRSPLNWNEFLRWTTDDIIGPEDFSSNTLNQDKRQYDSMGKAQQNTLEKRLKNLFDGADRMSLSVVISKLEWPLSEMANIGKLFAAYESGDKTPPPLQQVAERMGEANGLGRYTEDDEWARADTVAADGFEIARRDGKNGVVSKTGQTLIPFRNWEILSYKSRTAKVKIINYHSDHSIQCNILGKPQTQYIQITEVEQGVVDYSGQWVEEPDRTAFRLVEDLYDNATLTLGVVDRTPPSSEERRRRQLYAERAKRKKERRERDWQVCRPKVEAKVQSILDSYRRRGFDVD